MRILTFFSVLISGLLCLCPRKAYADGDRPVSLHGGHWAMVLQNRACDADGLTRLQDRAELEAFIKKGYLVRVSDTRSYYLDGPGSLDRKHAKDYRHTRPWAKAFLDTELKALKRKFGVRAKIPGLVRTQWYQDKICDSGNRAAICGDEWWEVSAHLTGAAVDISKKGMSSKAKAWFRQRLITLERAGEIDAIEERGAFHVLVRKAYAPDAPKKAKKHSSAKKRESKRKSKRKARH